jgi:hypothetical protein
MKTAKKQTQFKAKQSQFIRIAYCVLRSAKGNLKKQSQFTPKGVEQNLKEDFSRDRVVCGNQIWYKANITR